MKGSQKITRIQLSIDDQDKPVIFGLVTTDPDYKLSLKLNKKLGILLKNEDPVMIDAAGSEVTFSRFIDSSGAPDTVFYLVSNRTGKYFLLKQLRNIDFLFLIHDLNREQSPAGLLLKLRTIDSVTAVFDIDFGTLKDKNLNYLLR
jgi:hypothetical protein